MRLLKNVGIFAAGALCMAVLMPVGLSAMRGDERVKVPLTPPQVQGKATVVPYTDPFVELKNIFPPAAHMLGVLLSCRTEACLHNSQKAPMLTTMSIGVIYGVKSHLNANVEGADPEMKALLIEIHQALDTVQAPLYRLDELLKNRAQALMPR